MLSRRNFFRNAVAAISAATVGKTALAALPDASSSAFGTGADALATHIDEVFGTSS